jgi:hypothetical protein
MLLAIPPNALKARIGFLCGGTDDSRVAMKVEGVAAQLSNLRLQQFEMT